MADNAADFEQQVASYDEDELKHAIGAAINRLTGLQDFKGWMEEQGYDLLVNGFRQYLGRTAARLREKLEKAEELNVVD